ncbi:hypothetical protein ACH0BF_02275 [Pseudobacillus sp. 179-B 2D1 NHS]|uniref:hypothetical protein n=1 Tax=Pseudobacillus sp. 179-B 2D1 NHS TaxID=3374292 RepID=UPI0038790FCF
MNSQIKKKIKGAIGNQVIKERMFCQSCQQDKDVEINFSKEKVICQSCSIGYPISDETYNSFYKELNKLGIY